MVSIEDFITKERGNQNYTNLYMEKIDKYAKKKLRLLENRDSNLIKKYVKMHQFLSGVYTATCNMTEKNFKEGNPCPFCVKYVEEINKIDKEQFEWLKTTKIVNVEETNKINQEIAKLPNQKPKLILNDGKVFEIGNTFDKEISSKFALEEDKKIYNNFYLLRQRHEGKLAKTVFFAPVFDYATDEVKIYQFSPAIWNAIENSFTKAGYDFTSADFIITHNAVQGNWWSVSKKDSSPLSEEILTKYNAIKANIEKELDRKVAIPTIEAQKTAFEKHLSALQKKKDETQVEESEVPETKSSQQKQPSKLEVEDLF